MCTRPDFMGDTGWYAGDIVAYDASSPRAPNLLWEPGHLLWRPLGLLLYRLLGNAVPYAGEPKVRVAFILVLVSVACSVVCMLLFQAIGLRMGLPVYLSLILSGGFLSFYTVLEYSRSGTAYIPGLMWALLALWATIRAVDFNADGGRAALAGAFLGLSIVFWAPNLVGSLGIAAAALFWNRERADTRLLHRMRLVGYIAVVASIVVFASYSIAIIQLRISSLAGLQAWLATAAHGWSQSRQLVRMVSGLPRSFISLGFGGVDLKRYLFHDPYAPVTLANLVTRHLWKVGLFYLFTACLLWSLLRTALSRLFLWILLAGVLPVLFVAVFILESGAPERYLPLYPVLCVSVAYGLRGVPVKRPAALGMLIFIVVAAGVNLADLSIYSVTRKKEEAIRRLAPLQGKLSSDGLLALATQTDSIYEFEEAAIFDPARRNQPLPVYEVVEIASERAVRWRQNFAGRAKETLDRGRSVWVSKRFLADKPLPAWRWTEGDDRRVSWSDLKPFFQQIEYGSEVGGDDGFLQMLNSPRNLRFLSSESGQPNGGGFR